MYLDQTEVNLVLAIITITLTIFKGMKHLLYDNLFFLA